MAKYVMALDAGTTSNRCILFNEKGEICSMAQKEFTQYFPKPGWVEHDPREIWSTQLSVARQAMNQINAPPPLSASRSARSPLYQTVILPVLPVLLHLPHGLRSTSLSFRKNKRRSQARSSSETSLSALYLSGCHSTPKFFCTARQSHYTPVFLYSCPTRLLSLSGS